jgi:hypothetical protein
MIMRLGENLTDVDLDFDYNKKLKQTEPIFCSLAVASPCD